MYNGKFQMILKKLREVGFDEYYQAGSTSKYHEMNIVCVSKALNRQYWISKSFGKYQVIYRDDLSNSKNRSVRMECKNQTEVVNRLSEIAEEIKQKQLVAV